MCDWIQSNWYELGSLLVQCAALALLAWFGRSALGILGEAYGRKESAEARSELAGGHVTLETTFAHGGREERARKHFRVPVPRFNLIAWLQEPMGRRSRVAPWRRVIKWLQSPAGS